MERGRGSLFCPLLRDREGLAAHHLPPNKLLRLTCSRPMGALDLVKLPPLMELTTGRPPCPCREPSPERGGIAGRMRHRSDGERRLVRGRTGPPAAPCGRAQKGRSFLLSALH